MKKLLFIVACFFLIGCQANEEPIDDQEVEVDEEENLIEETDQDEDEEVEVDQEDEDETESDDANDQAEEPELEPEQENDDQDASNESNSESGRYSSDEAIDLVQEYIQGTDSEIGLNFNFDGEDEQGNYRIQVFEVIDHGEGESHTATYGWYLVDPETGEITDMFD